MVGREGSKCPRCDKKGLVSGLVPYQISLEDAVYMCSSSECLYPLGLRETTSQNIVRRNVYEIPIRTRKLRLSNSSTPIASPAVTPLTSPQQTPRSSPVDVVFSGVRSPEFRLRSPPLVKRAVCESILRAQCDTNRLASVQQNACNGNIKTLCPPQNENVWLAVNKPDGSTESRFGTLKWNSYRDSVVKSIGLTNSGVREAELLKRTQISSASSTKTTTSPQFLRPAISNDNNSDLSSIRNYANGQNSSTTQRSNDFKSNIIVKSNSIIKPIATDSGVNTDANAHGLNGPVLYHEANGNNDCTRNSLSHRQTNHAFTNSPVKSQQRSETVNRDFSNCFVQWTNKDALCWLDVTLTFIVCCFSLSKLLEQTKFSSSLLRELIECHQKVQNINRQSLEFRHCAKLAREGRVMSILTSIGKVTVKMGGGSAVISSDSLGNAVKTDMPNVPVNCVRNSSQTSEKVLHSPVRVSEKEWLMTPDALEDRAVALVNRAETMMEEIREKVWQRLYTKLHCDKGSNDSPVFALPLLLKEHAEFEEHFRMRYEWHMTCNQCGYTHVDAQKRTLPSFPRVEKDFCMSAPYFLRSCFRCHIPGQKMTMVFTDLPPCIIAHFVDGLHNADLRDYDFMLGTSRYVLTGVIQYVNDPDHFIGWVRQQRSQQAG